jgi:hypothetical protein
LVSAAVLGRQAGLPFGVDILITRDIRLAPEDFDPGVADRGDPWRDAIEICRGRHSPCTAQVAPDEAQTTHRHPAAAMFHGWRASLGFAIFQT